MKYFWLIFSIYIAILAAIPCGDKPACNEFAETHNTTGNSGDSHEEETCSPLCICACCGSQGMTLKDFYTFSAASRHAPEVKVPSYQSQFVSTFVANIWQPPKLS